MFLNMIILIPKGVVWVLFVACCLLRVLVACCRLFWLLVLVACYYSVF